MLGLKRPVMPMSMILDEATKVYHTSAAGEAMLLPEG
jgi:hypothetical protein